VRLSEVGNKFISVTAAAKPQLYSYLEDDTHQIERHPYKHDGKWNVHEKNFIWQGIINHK
jgi:hypothetical protein